MTVEESLFLPPFNLRPDDVAWVRKIRDGLPAEDRIRQLFVHLSVGDDPDEARRLAALKPGGIHRFMGPSLEDAHAATRIMLAESEIPLLITGDIEGGGHLSPVFTGFPNQLGLAAADDPALSRRVLAAMTAEAKVLGVNWSLTPVIDVNHETGSAIVGTRSYGSDLGRIRAQALAHVETLQSMGVAATAKHWPGEGYDFRDQHLVTTINPLPLEEWERVFGRLYRGLIDAQIMTVMSAHIALPAFAAKMGVPDGLERYRPASVSKLLNQDLLRGQLGFNGLIVSDATAMAGLGSWAARAVAAPEVIASGCDMFLFSTNEARDFAFMLDGLRAGRLSEQRLDDALTRILGLKAALGLHRKSLEERLPPLDTVRAIVRSPAHSAVAREAADRSITLVKDTGPHLPLNPTRHRRITLVSRGAPSLFLGAARRPMDAFTGALAARGFILTAFDPANPPTPETTDLLLYVLASESSLGLSRIFIDWGAEHGSFHTMMERYWHDIPTVMVSFGHPYFLTDAPRVPAYVNAYSTVEAAQIATAERLLGDAPFTGVSPVDPFANTPDAKH